MRLLLLAALLSSPVISRAQTPAVQNSAATSIPQKMLQGLTAEMHKREATIINTAPHSAVEKKDDIDYTRAQDAFLETIVLQKGGSWFTQSASSETPVPYELKGFEISEPRDQLVTDTERLKGIEEKVAFSFQIAAHRTYTKPHGWGEWKPGNPIHMHGFTMVLTEGRWEVSESPLGYYRVKR
tara:strand:+ start:625 stop:1173 length:549 start_codon:yes stop_codon:yes gene_type:complete